MVVYEIACTQCVVRFFFLMIRRPPRSTLDRSSAASDVYKRQREAFLLLWDECLAKLKDGATQPSGGKLTEKMNDALSLIHISEPTRPY